MNKIKKIFSIFLIGIIFPAVAISQTIQWKSGNSTSGDEDSGTITWTMTAASYSGSCDPCNVQVSVKNSSTSTSSSDYSYFGTKTITITANGDYTVQFTLLDDNIDEDEEKLKNYQLTMPDTNENPTFLNIPDNNGCQSPSPHKRPFRTALDPMQCNRYEIGKFAKEAYDL